jgi:hypothetical protein
MSTEGKSVHSKYSNALQSYIPTREIIFIQDILEKVNN